ncbi:FAD:protein FMN transferase [Paraliobacillus sp. PM-2]|uniref:FAD:protein FMN transferase n=1 Tax=Paraliobacillus sp. PM-2 TaxID=1462524 RepID=UPI0021004375|nr:FAD:protein FMN transferase [Paraliobacillus sp. PM-2]
MLIVTGCNAKEPNVMDSPYKRTEFMMGTIVTLKIYDEGKEDVVDAAFSEMEKLARQIGVEETHSQIDQINDAAGDSPVEVSDAIFSLIQAGKNYSEQAEGSFDITIGPLTSLWHIGYEDAKKPTQEEIDTVLPLINYQKVVLNEAEQTVFLKEKGMQIDLGAIAKGFIADQVTELLDDNNVTTAIIDLGGNIYVKGNNPKGSEWTVGIQDPFTERGKIVGKLHASNQSIVTSGIYERYLEVDGERYHHILNPIDGYPYKNKIAGVTIISEKSMDGDALSTLIFSKGLKEGLSYIEKQEGVEAIFVDKDRQIFITSGLDNEFELTNEAFKLGNREDIQ